MNLNLIKSLMNQIHTEQNLCNWAKVYSCLTWQKLKFARLVKARLTETTITQDLAFEFSLMALSRELPVKLYEARDEKANGNDFELFIETEKGYVLFPVQAKLLYKSNKYEKIPHSSSGKSQIDSLLNYSKKRGGIGLYLFYNYHPHFALYEDDNLLGDHQMELYGLSFCLALHVKNKFYRKSLATPYQWKWRVPSFYDIHPAYGFPFHVLFSSLIDGDSEEWTKFFEATPTIMDNVIYYDKKQIKDDINWKDIAPLPSISGIPIPVNPKIRERDDQFFLQENFMFNPKFRIVFSKEIETSILFRVS
jgi:hypothetical protein